MASSENRSGWAESINQTAEHSSVLLSFAVKQTLAIAWARAIMDVTGSESESRTHVGSHSSGRIFGDTNMSFAHERTTPPLEIDEPGIDKQIYARLYERTDEVQVRRAFPAFMGRSAMKPSIAIRGGNIQVIKFEGAVAEASKNEAGDYASLAPYPDSYVLSPINNPDGVEKFDQFLVDLENITSCFSIPEQRVVEQKYQVRLSQI
jgi:hypothetical protein